MTTITIPKETEKNKDLIAVPRIVYDEFLTWRKTIRAAKTFKPTASEKKALTRARKNFLRGNYVRFEDI